MENDKELNEAVSKPSPNDAARLAEENEALMERLKKTEQERNKALHRADRAEFDLQYFNRICDARIEGKSAYSNGKGLGENPYAALDLRNSWTGGWLAEEERRILMRRAETAERRAAELETSLEAASGNRKESR